MFRDNIDQDSDIFKYIKPMDNEMFSLMGGSNLQDLIYYIENYYLELRNSLGFDRNITFGLELEFEKANYENIINMLRKYSLDHSWIMVSDVSLVEGAEINSPILRDTNKTWDEIDNVFMIIDKNAIIGENSGGHIHIGTQVLGDKPNSWLNFIKLWAVYENIIYRFLYGDFLTARPNMNKYARPCRNYFEDDYLDLVDMDNLTTEDVIRRIYHIRNQAVNFYNINHFDDLNKIFKKNTIEFRCPNGTIDAVIWQNNVNLLVNLLLYAKGERYNDEIIQERRNIDRDRYSSLKFYGEVYLQQALELCDMLFTNNLDKVYFLKQYLKSFEVGKKILSRTKPLTKNKTLFR